MIVLPRQQKKRGETLSDMGEVEINGNGFLPSQTMNSPLPGKKETPTPMAGSTYLWNEKGYLSPRNAFSVVIFRLSHEFSWKMNSLWIVDPTRGSCQRTFMSYSGLTSFSLRNKHKVKRKPSLDKSGNKHFSDPTKTSPAKKRTFRPVNDHGAHPNSGKSAETFALEKKNPFHQASFQFCTHWVSCTSQATNKAAAKAPAG